MTTSSLIKNSFPALATILLCFFVQAIEQGFGIGNPRTITLSAGRFTTDIIVNLGLLLCLPAIGAVGAGLAKWLGHSKKAAVESVMSPVALVSAMLVTLLIVDFITTRGLVSSLSYSSGILLGWVVIPAAALLCGYYPGWILTPHPALQLRQSQ